VVERAQLVEETLADRLVQAIEWLIQEQHAWPGRHGPCDGDSLLLPARELVRVAPAQPVQTDQIQRRVYPCLVLAFWHPTYGSPNATFSLTVRCGNSRNRWWIIARPRRSGGSRPISPSSR
jgi:hypothetical protein